MIYTSYFGNRSIKGDERCVSIARYAPTWYKGLKCSLLNPSYDLFIHWKENHDEDFYVKVFGEMLSRLDVHKAYKALDEKILLCYEGPGQFCHRNLVGHWFRENGYKCEEL